MLSITDLHASVGDKPILRGLSLELPVGEVHAVMEPNACTSVILGLVPRTHGPGVSDAGVSAASVQTQPRALGQVAPWVLGTSSRMTVGMTVEGC